MTDLMSVILIAQSIFTTAKIRQCWLQKIARDIQLYKENVMYDYFPAQDMFYPIIPGN